jgi:hypothetical protein
MATAFSTARRALAGMAAALSLFATTGCGASSPSPSEVPSEKLRPPLTDAELHALVRTVATIRGLPEKSPIPINRLDDQQFAAALRVRDRLGDAPPDGESAGFLVAFNLAPTQASARSSMGDVLEEQVIGFYERSSRRVFVRTTGFLTEEAARKERAVLAHEIQHALQAQHFRIADFDAMPHEDERLAYLSLLEGDAMVAMLAYMGGENGVPLRRVLRRIQDMTRDVPLNELLKNDGRSRALMAALPILRERLTFPYYGGMSFMADMFRAGGFPLMNAVFARPPISSEQVLHPSKYLEGEPPLPVRPPEVPAGYRVLATERMGELQTRVLLTGCAGHAAAIRAAAGWGGDAFRVLGAPDGRVAVLWSTRWDSIEDAAEFHAALGASPACWTSGALGAGGVRIEGGFSIVRNGVRVAFGRGLPEPLLSQAMTAMMAQPDDPPPPKTPTVGVEIPPLRPIPKAYRGYISQGIYQSPWLGVTALLPSDVRASTRSPTAELALERDGLPLAGYLVLSDRMATPEWNALTLYEIGGAFARELEDRQLVLMGSTESFGALGRAVERTWRVEGTTVEVRAVLVPICEGTGSLVFVQLYTEPLGRQQLDYWLNTFRWVPGVRPPVCEMLNPL